MTTRLSEIDTCAETPDAVSAEETFAIESAAPDPLLREDAAEVPQLMAPHPDAEFDILEDEEEAARKGVGTGVGVVAFDKVKETIEYVDKEGEKVEAELELPLGLALGDDAERQRLTRLEEERITEAERRRGGKAGKGVEDIRREVVAEMQRRRAHSTAAADAADAVESRQEELREELRHERDRREIARDIDEMMTRRRDHEHGGKEAEVVVARVHEVNEDDQMVVQELWNGTLAEHAELEPALDEARSLKTYFGETLHEANEARREAEEEPERNRRLYYRQMGVDDDEWTGAEEAERVDSRLPRPEAAAAGVRDLGLAVMIAEEAEAEAYNAAAARDRKRQREEAEAGGTPAFPVKRRNSLRGAVAARVRGDRESDAADRAREEKLAREDRTTADTPAVTDGPDVDADPQEDIYDFLDNRSVYQTYLGEQFDYGDMNEADQGDYDTLRPFDGDDDLLQDERGEKKATEKESHREGQQVLDEVREEVLMLEGCQSSRKLRPEPPSDDAQPLLRKVERLPAVRHTARDRSRRTRDTSA